MDFIRFIEVVESQYKQDLHCFRKELLHNFAGASCKNLFYQYKSYFKTCLHLARLKQCPKANLPEYNERSANLSEAVLFFSGIPSILWVVAMEMRVKNNPFLSTSFLFSTKNPNDPDFNFDLISDCIKEMLP